MSRTTTTTTTTTTPISDAVTRHFHSSSPDVHPEVLQTLSATINHGESAAVLNLIREPLGRRAEPRLQVKALVLLHALAEKAPHGRLEVATILANDEWSSLLLRVASNTINTNVAELVMIGALGWNVMFPRAGFNRLLASLQNSRSPDLRRRFLQVEREFKRQVQKDGSGRILMAAPATVGSPLGEEPPSPFRRVFATLFANVTGDVEHLHYLMQFARDDDVSRNETARCCVEHKRKLMRLLENGEQPIDRALALDALVGLVEALAFHDAAFGSHFCASRPVPTSGRSSSTSVVDDSSTPDSAAMASPASPTVEVSGETVDASPGTEQQQHNRAVRVPSLNLPSSRDPAPLSQPPIVTPRDLAIAAVHCMATPRVLRATAVAPEAAEAEAAKNAPPAMLRRHAAALTSTGTKGGAMPQASTAARPALLQRRTPASAPKGNSVSRTGGTPTTNNANTPNLRFRAL